MNFRFTDIYRTLSRLSIFILPLMFLCLLYLIPYANMFVDGVKECVVNRWWVHQYVSDVEDNYPQELIAPDYVTDRVSEPPLRKIPSGYETYQIPHPKIVYVDVPTQRVWCCEDGIIVAYFITSTGVKEHQTRPGDYRVVEKIKYARSRNYFEEGEMRWWGMPYYLELNGVGIHAVPTLFMRKKEPMETLGRPASHRCIRLGYEELDSINGKSPAEWFYGWAEIGTPVLIRGKYDFGEE